MLSREARAINRGEWSTDLENKIRDSIRNIQFGTVTLVIQDGKVIQLDKNEKLRL